MFSSVLLLLGLASISQCCKDNDMIFNDSPIDLVYQVSVKHKRHDAHLCTGILLQPFFVLTVAQCFVPNKWGRDDIKVEIGLKRYMLLNDTPNHISMVREIIVHKEHNVYLNDIALLVLSSTFDLWPPGFQYARLPEQGEDVGEINSTIVSGFIERTNDTNIPGTHNMLFKTEMEYAQNRITVRDQYTCRKMYVTADSELCTYDPCHEAKNCTYNGLLQKNLGGPLIVDGKVIGLLSQKAICSHLHDIPAIFTRVSSYRTWIDTHMNKRWAARGTCPIGCQAYNARWHG